MKQARRIFALCVLLAALLALSTFAQAAGEVVTHDVDQIRELLRQDGDVTIKLDADAEKKITAYSDFEDDKWNSQFVWTQLGSGNKTIDLNGHRLYVYDQSARSLGSLEIEPFKYIQGALLMEIPAGASLTVNDSAGGGKIWMDAEMPPKDEIEGNGLLMERNIFAVTGGDLTVNGGEIHAGRSKNIYAQAATKNDKYYKLIPNLLGFYEHLYGYATWFLSGTAITAESGNVTINGGDIWGRGWDNWTLITRVPGAPNGADDFRDRCAALRVRGGNVNIVSGSFHGRSDADAVQVNNTANLTVESGTFDVATNEWLVIPGVEWGGTADNVNAIFFHDSVFEVHEGYVGSFGVPEECIDDQSVKVVKGNTMTLSKNAIDPYIIVDEVNIYINSPLAYGDPADEASDVYNVPDGCNVESITWYENGRIVENAGSTYFEEGASYYVKIALSVDIDAGTKFKNNLTNVSINGKDAEIYRPDAENIVLTAHFGECIAALESLEFSAEEPQEGTYASKWVDTDEYEQYFPVGGYSDYGEYRTWYVSDDGESDWTEMDSEDTFEAGKYYRLSFEVHTGEGQEFAVDASGVGVQPDVTATVNGIDAEVSKVYEQDPTEHIAVTVDFGKCPALVSQVELTVTAPKEGNTPSYTVGCASDAYYAVGGNSNYTDYRQWLESDTGYDGWTEMTPGDSFKADKYYMFVTDIYTKNGYEFPTYDDGTSIVPGVNAYVNSWAANVSKGYEQDPSRYITVEYFFGICNDSVVENIIVENATEPVAGQKPDYNCSIRGTGYQMNTAKNNENYGVRNGMQWMTGDWDYVFPNDTFVPGKTYICRLNLVADDGFTFAQDKDYRPTVTATVNGGAAVIEEDWTKTNEARIYYTFTCAQPEVSTIKLYDLEAPQGGETPDTSVTSAYPALYEVTAVEWFDEEDGAVSEFEQGRMYTVEITVAAKEYDGVDGCLFADTVRAYIDGTEVAGWYNTVTVNNDNTVTLRYQFRKPAPAPEAPPAEEFYVGFFAGEGNGGGVGDYYAENYVLTLPAPAEVNVFAPDGKEFDYWQIGNPETARKQPGETITVTGETYIYAIWKDAKAASFNGTEYATLAEAIAAAEAAGGGTVTLIADTTEGMMMLSPGVTIDINGQTLSTDGAMSFGGYVVDSSADKSGKVICMQGMLMLDAANPDLAVWNGTDGYFFTEIEQVLTQVNSGSGSYKLTFLPRFTQIAKVAPLLADNGGADHGVKIMVKLLWNGGEKTLTYSEDMIKTVYAGNAFTVTLTGYEAFLAQNLQLQVVVEANGVTAASEPISVS